MKSRNRLKCIEILEGNHYNITDYDRYPNGKKNYNKKIIIREDNKYIKFIWDTGQLIMRLDKYNELPKRKRELLLNIR